MGVTAGIFLDSILLKEMRYLVYIRYLCTFPVKFRLFETHNIAFRFCILTKTPCNSVLVWPRLKEITKEIIKVTEEYKRFHRDESQAIIISARVSSYILCNTAYTRDRIYFNIAIYLYISSVKQSTPMAHVWWRSPTGLGKRSVQMVCRL